MADKKKELPKLRLRGVFVYPRLGEPDTKFKKEGEYTIRVKIAEADAAQLIKTIDAAAAESLKEAKANAKTPKEAKGWETKYLPYERETDDEDEPTGFILFKASMKASGISKKTGKPWSRKPDVFDAKRKPMAGSKVWGGSEGIVIVEVVPYHPTTQVGASVSLALQAVQVINLVTGSGRDAASYGFDDEEGYEDTGSTEETEKTTENGGEQEGSNDAEAGEEDF